MVPYTKADGFSLLEVMMALGILSVGVLAVATVVGMSHRMLAGGDQNTRIAYLAQNKMETLRAQRPVHVENQEEEIEKMRLKWSSVPGTDNPRLWTITVEVAPPNRTDSPYVLKSLVFY